MQQCIITGSPISNVWWLKDGQPLRTGSRVRLLSQEQISITSVLKDDRGMYQCFAKNEHSVIQATAEMRLGGLAYFHGSFDVTFPNEQNFLSLYYRSISAVSLPVY